MPLDIKPTGIKECSLLTVETFARKFTIKPNGCWEWIGFVIIELWALYRSRGVKPTEEYKGGTLSEAVWRLSKENKLFKAVFIALSLVLAYHFYLDSN